jgi:hypothetical protein
VSSDGGENLSGGACGGPASNIGPPPPGDYDAGSWQLAVYNKFQNNATALIRHWDAFGGIPFYEGGGGTTPDDDTPMKQGRSFQPIPSTSDAAFFLDVAGMTGGTYVGIDDLLVCETPLPLSQGYWHRQCLGADLISPGRNGRGPNEPTAPDFVKTLLPDANALLEEKVFVFAACEEGMDADPPSDPCERALKQYTALLFNLASERLENACQVTVADSGCESATLGELIDELAGLINNGDGGSCQLAAACAAAVNEGGVVPGSTGAGLTLEDLVAVDPGSSPAERRNRGASRPDARSLSGSLQGLRELDRGGLHPQTLRGTREPSSIDRLTGLSRRAARESAAETRAHMAAVADGSTPEEVRSRSLDALLDALSGGYEPEVRLKIAAVLIGQVDEAWDSLLAEHLETLRTEAAEFGKNRLAAEAERLVKKLEGARE